MKVAIIGAGIAGLVAIRSCIQEGYECDAFEQTEFVGGIWNYTDEVGLDKNGLPINTPMYKDLKTNIPKEVMTFENFPYQENIYESYLTHIQVLDYIKEFAEKMKLKKHIKFLRLVTHIEPIENNKWNVEIQDVITKNKEIKIYDAVVVANGKFHVPYVPEIPGLKSFQGNCIHCNDFRVVDPYKNRKVLIIGGGPSGLDIADHVNKVAKKVYLGVKSLRTNFYVEPRSFHTFLLEKIDGNIVYSKDGTKDEFDDIILCTGYCYSFPFLSEKCKVTVDDNYVKGLYKECLCIEHPTLIFLGLPVYVCPIPTYEIQMRFFMAILNKQIKLCSKIEMVKDTEDKRNAKDCSNRHYHRKGAKGEREYWDDLAQTALIKNIPTVFNKLHEYLLSNKRDITKVFRIKNDEEFEEICSKNFNTTNF